MDGLSLWLYLLFSPCKLSISAYSTHKYLSTFLSSVEHQVVFSPPFFLSLIDRCASSLVRHTGGLLGLPFCVLCVPAYLWLLPSQVQCLCTSPLALLPFHTYSVVRSFHCYVCTYCLYQFLNRFLTFLLFLNSFWSRLGP